MGTSQTYMTGAGTAGQYQSTSENTRISDSGGFAGAFNNNKNAINGGSYGQANKDDLVETEIYAGSGADSLRTNAAWTGNGSANPTRVIMRQIDNSNGAYQEFLKDNINNKPLIYQKVDDGQIVAVFQADMRGQNYNTGNTPLTIGTSTVTVNPTVAGIGNSSVNANYARNPASEFVLKLDFVDTALAATGPHFDAAGGRPVGGGPLLGQNVTASKYTWTAGSGWAAYTGQATYKSVYYPSLSSTGFTLMSIYGAGTYNYGTATFDHANVNWRSYLDTAQSPCGGSIWCP